MIISKTPFRISFVGGGTDYPAWFKENKGAVLATTIDKYCYIYCRYLPPYFEHKSRIIYKQMEYVQSNNNIGHPAVREILRYLNIEDGLEIYHDKDLPSRRGLGSSSTFVVGLLNALYTLNNSTIPPKQLAQEAIYIEQFAIKEAVGCQDQYLSSYGGFRHIEFERNKTTVSSHIESGELINYLMLFDTGTYRIASIVASKLVEQIPYKKKELTAMYDMVVEGQSLLERKNYMGFGKLLHEEWLLKRSLTDRISTSIVDGIYETALKTGAIGGKLLGAGGGGFMLLFAEPEKQKEIKKALRGLTHVPFKLEKDGSTIIYKRAD